MKQGIWTIKKTVTVSGGHKLDLSYDSPCSNFHGHNWKITVHCRGPLDENGMVIDFQRIKEIVHGIADHKVIDIGTNPTAENIAKFIQGRVPLCFRVDVEETEGAVATYEVQGE